MVSESCKKFVGVLEFKLYIVRPEFTGTLAIKSGRHPILETVQAAGTLVANDVYCCDASSFQIIQGPKYTSFRDVRTSC